MNKVPHFNKGRLAGDKNPSKRLEVRLKISLALRGKKRKPLSEEHKRKIGIGSSLALNRPEVQEKLSKAHKGIPKSKEHNLKNSLAQKGEKGNNWKGGKTVETMIIRSSAEYKRWRQSVFERDDFTCNECRQVGGYLQADHIKPFAFFPELRFEIGNGRTLCKECHKKTDTFGIKSKQLYGK